MSTRRKPCHGDRDGKTFSRKRDGKRLNRQQDKVWSVVKDRRWHTLREIARKARAPEASVSARLRDFRKGRFGKKLVSKEYLGNGLWQYRVR